MHDILPGLMFHIPMPINLDAKAFAIRWRAIGGQSFA